MSFAAESFTPVLSLFGGILIGAAAVMLMALNGRIAGISGIVSGLLPPQSDRTGLAWRLAFVVGLVSAPLLQMVIAGFERGHIHQVASLPILGVAGLLVGFGTVLGNGCTSGHGVCGIARASRRSFVAVLVFMASAMTTVFIVRHILAGGSQ
ncbi:MAG: YeeE/YedE family protein [Rhodospirillaceae bacterium]|nr:YeeE/YedE family protein [Rhodospirillaceae bacterium]